MNRRAFVISVGTASIGIIRRPWMTARNLPVDAILARVPEIKVSRIADLPDFAVWFGTTARISIATAGPVSIAARPKPAGLLAFDAAGGVLIYSPATTDEDEFDLEVRDAQSARTVRVLPLQPLPPEAGLVAKVEPGILRAPPDPDFCEGSERSDADCPSASARRFQTIAIRSIANPHREGWFNNGTRSALRSIVWSGKTIVIDNSEGSISHALNGAADVADLALYADRVIVRAAFLLPGTNITIYARELSFEDVGPGPTSAINVTPESITIAGAPAPGRGPSILLYIGDILVNGRQPAALASARIVARGASASGATGGQGGTIRSTVRTTSFVSDVQGGDTAALSGGSYTTINVDYAVGWLHPAALHAVLMFARDLYLNGNIAAALSITRWYSDALSVASSRFRPEFRAAYEGLKFDLSALLVRLTSGVDYFGNPAGWVPLLSLTGAVQLYERDVTDSIRDIALAEWIRAKADTLSAQDRALQAQRNAADGRIDANVKAFDELSNLIPKLQAESEDLSTQINKYEALAADRQRQLEDENKPPTWKIALAFVGEACKLVPVYQPGLAAAGTVLETAAQFNDKDPVGSATNLLNSGLALEKSLPATRDNVGELKKTLQRGDKSTKAYFLGVARVGADMEPKLKALARLTIAQAEDNAKLDADLGHINATDPRMRELVAALKDLNRRKVETARRIVDATIEFSRLASEIEADTRAVDAIEAQLLEAAVQRDHEALAAVAEIGQRARSRLLYYRYLIARAYEYQTLAPFPHGLDDSAVYNQITDLVRGDDYSKITPEEFSRLGDTYRGEIANLRRELVNQLPTLTAHVRLESDVELLPDQLRRLNEGKESGVAINLSEWGFADVDNERIISVTVSAFENRSHLWQRNRADKLLVTVEHGGRSTIRDIDKFWSFSHFVRDHGRVVPIMWTTELFPNEHNDKRIKLRESTSVATLDWMTGSSASAEQLLVHPGLRGSDIIVRVVPEPAGSRFDLSSLRLHVTHEGVPRPAGPDARVALWVTTSGALTPLIRCSADLAERTRGRGSFERIYQNGNVVLEAPKQFGRRKFLMWQTREGAWGAVRTVVSTDPKVEYRLNRSTWMEAVYEELTDA